MKRIVSGLFLVVFVAVASVACGQSGVYHPTTQSQPSLIMANVFTPNNDGVNDVYEPLRDYFTSYTIEIFNRWGQVVFHGNHGKLWDGNTNGDAAPAGVYVYRVEGYGPGGVRVDRTGTITLIR